MVPPLAAPSRGALQRNAGYALLALFFAFFQLRIIIILLPKVFLRSAQVAEGVVLGEPHWRVYQGRVLGPYLVDALRGFADSLVGAYTAFSVLTLFAAGFGLLVLTHRLGDRHRPPVPAFLLFHVSFLFLLPCLWLYAWDLLSLLLFTVFNYLVLRRADRIWLAVLFAVAVLNHEIAYFMAGWLVLDPIVRYVASRRAGVAGARFDWVTASMGLVLLVAGIAAVEGLREKLLVREVMRPEELPPHSIYGRSFHFSLAQNLSALAESFTLSFPLAFPFVVTLLLLGIVALAVRLAWSDWARYAALSAVTIGMVAAFLCFGLVFETRVLMPLVPFVAMNAWAAFRRPG